MHKFCAIGLYLMYLYRNFAASKYWKAFGFLYKFTTMAR